jgi:hypothetical protein
MALLDGLADHLGSMDATSKARVRSVIENPTSETWERAYSLVLHPKGLTLWAAVCCVDPDFRTTGPGSDERGRRRQWRQVPDQLTIVRAIRAVVSGCVTRKHVLARSLDGP